jgi:hypothetical protein
MLGMYSFNMPGNFQYNASDIITQGQDMITAVEEKIKSESTTAWFFMSK